MLVKFHAPVREHLKTVRYRKYSQSAKTRHQNKSQKTEQGIASIRRAPKLRVNFKKFAR